MLTETHITHFKKMPCQFLSLALLHPVWILYRASKKEALSSVWARFWTRVWSMMNLSITKLLESFPSYAPCPLQPPVIMTKLFTWPPQTLLRPLAGHSSALISSKVQLCWAVNSAGRIQGMRLGMGVWHLPQSIFGYSPFCWLCENSAVILHVDGHPQYLKWIRVDLMASNGSVKHCE